MVVAGALGLDRGERGIGIDMAGAGTILQLGDGVLHRSCAADLGVRIAFVLFGMTAGAIRAIAWISPSCRIRVGGVAADARQIQTAGMVAGIFRRGVFKNERRPRGD